MKLTEFHAKNYFNATMGGKDLHGLFAMAIGCHSMDIPDHKDPLFCIQDRPFGDKTGFINTQA